MPEQLKRADCGWSSNAKGLLNPEVAARLSDDTTFRKAVGIALTDAANIPKAEIMHIW